MLEKHKGISEEIADAFLWDFLRKETEDPYTFEYLYHSCVMRLPNQRWDSGHNELVNEDLNF